MFRLMFTPTDKTNKRDLCVLDQVYEKFNIFKIDPDKRIVHVGMDPNIEHGYRSYDEMEELLKEGWDIYKLEYKFIEGYHGVVEIKIPEGYEVTVVLK